MPGTEAAWQGVGFGGETRWKEREKEMTWEANGKSYNFEQKPALPSYWDLKNLVAAIRESATQFRPFGGLTASSS